MRGWIFPCLRVESSFLDCRRNGSEHNPSTACSRNEAVQSGLVPPHYCMLCRAAVRMTIGFLLGPQGRANLHPHTLVLVPKSVVPTGDEPGPRGRSCRRGRRRESAMTPLWKRKKAEAEVRSALCWRSWRGRRCPIHGSTFQPWHRPVVLNRHQLARTDCGVGVDDCSVFLPGLVLSPSFTIDGC